jgi:hypothetical protein
MKSTELRIGNYVMDRGNKVLLIDHWEYKDKISEKRIDGYHPFTEFVEHLQPITLTEEWLLKFGFKKDGIYYENAHLQLSKMTSKNGYDCYCTDLDFSIFMTELEHVHSLQNLYFALTGEEITLNN